MSKIHPSVRELVLTMLSALWQMDKDAVVEWINTTWSHCVGVTKDTAHHKDTLHFS